MNATFYEAGKTFPLPTPVAIAERKAAGPDVQLSLTDYIVKTALLSFEEGEQISVSQIAKKLANYTINTDDMSVAFPTFNKTFGSNQPVEIAFNFEGDFDFNMKTTGQALTAAHNANISVTISVGGKVVC